MEYEALKLIQQTALRAEEADSIGDPLAHTLQILQPGETLHSLEKYSDYRTRFRGTFNTTRIADFASYLGEKANADADSKVPVYIDLKKLGATAIFNLFEDREPGHGDDRAVLALEATAPYKALQAIADSKQDQRELAEFIEEWAPYLLCYGEDYYSLADPGRIVGGYPLGKVVAAVRGITIKEKREAGTQVRNHGETRSVMEAIDAKGDGEFLPSVIVFTCIPFDGFRERFLELRVGVITSDPPKIALRLIGKERHEEELGLELKEKLDLVLGNNSHNLIGGFSLGN
jgi:uncharacterized protein YfdQ (DUF2303 family)